MRGRSYHSASHRVNREAFFRCFASPREPSARPAAAPSTAARAAATTEPRMAPVIGCSPTVPTTIRLAPTSLARPRGSRPPGLWPTSRVSNSTPAASRSAFARSSAWLPTSSSASAHVLPALAAERRDVVAEDDHDLLPSAGASSIVCASAALADGGTVVAEDDRAALTASRSGSAVSSLRLEESGAARHWRNIRTTPRSSEKIPIASGGADPEPATAGVGVGGFARSIDDLTKHVAEHHRAERGAEPGDQRTSGRR